MFRLVSRPAIPRQMLLPHSPAVLQIRRIMEPRYDPKGSLTISETIMGDHRELKNYYTRIMATDDKDFDTKLRWRNQFTWELARHVLGEEIVLYPAYEKYLGPLGKATADKDRKSHQRIKDNLEYFQRLYPQSPRFKQKLVELMEDLDLHIRAEEQDELPLLEAALLRSLTYPGERGESQELTRSYTRTKMFVPTRIHPWLPNKPPYETVVGFLATPMDKLADMFRRFPKEKQRTTESWNGEGLR